MKRPDAKSRGRPRQAENDEQEMRQRIVAVARKLFLRDGVEAVSMRNLASEVGCSPMWLYRYFSSKQDLLWKIWDVFLGELFARLEKIVAATPRARLELLAFAYVDYWLENPDRFVIVFLQKDLVPDATRNYLESSALIERFDLFERVVRDAQAQGDLQAADATAIARGLACVLQGLVVNFVTLPEYPWGDTDSLSRLTIRGYLAGMSSKPGTADPAAKKPPRKK